MHMYLWILQFVMHFHCDNYRKEIFKFSPEFLFSSTKSNSRKGTDEESSCKERKDADRESGNACFPSTNISLIVLF
jgi:hypothetical protein